MPFYEDAFVKVGKGPINERVEAVRGMEKRPDGSEKKVRPESPACNERYGRWVPGGDTHLHLEEIAQKVIEGALDYETGVRLTEALKDAMGKPCATKRDLLVVLARMREAHHAGRD